MQSDSDSLTATVEFRELPLFERAHAWRAYWIAAIRPFVGTDVLEVGAGIGSATAALAGSARRWRCLEPDPENFAVLRRKLGAGQLPDRCSITHGTLADIDPGERFDTILYVDVLEHIAEDRAELARAAGLLQPGGRLIVVSPAYQFLFTAFDRAIGHYRRYSSGSLAALGPGALRLERSFYLDSVGMVASLGNRLVMRTAQPPSWSIELWSRFLVPMSRVVDRIVLHAFGKTVVAVWRRERPRAGSGAAGEPVEVG